MTIQTTKIPRRQKCVDKNHPYIGGADDVIDDKSELTIGELVGNKDYDAAAHSGMGRVTLKKNIVNGVNTLTQSMINESNTIYVIQYDFDLRNEPITIPENCVLKFDGGSLSNGVLIGNNTKLSESKNNIFKGNIKITGTWETPYISTEFFEVKTGVNFLDNVEALNSEEIKSTVYIENAVYTYDLAPDPNWAGMKVKSNTEYIFNGTINLINNNHGYYGIFELLNVHDVYIHGNGVIIGDKDENTNHYESGHAFRVRGCSNITIEGFTISKCIGDGVYINGGSNHKVKSCNISYCGRQGVSAVNGHNIYIEDCDISHIFAEYGSSAMWGIDIEPNTTNIINNIFIKNCYIHDTNKGICCTHALDSEIHDIYINDNIVDVEHCALFLDSNVYNTIVYNNILKGYSTTQYETVGYFTGIQNKGKNTICNNIIECNIFNFATTKGNGLYYGNTIKGKYCYFDNADGVYENTFNMTCGATDNDLMLVGGDFYRNTVKVIKSSFRVGNVFNANNSSVFIYQNTIFDSNIDSSLYGQVFSFARNASNAKIFSNVKSSNIRNDNLSYTNPFIDANINNVKSKGSNLFDDNAGMPVVYNGTRFTDFLGYSLNFVDVNVDFSTKTIDSKVTTAKIKSIKGKTNILHQILVNGDFATNSDWENYANTSITIQDSVMTVTANADGTTEIIQKRLESSIIGHKYLILVKSNTALSMEGYGVSVILPLRHIKDDIYYIIITAENISTQFYLVNYNMLEGESFTVSRACLIDLTELYGSNELIPNDSLVLENIDVDKYYNTGKRLIYLRNFKIRSKTRNGFTIDECNVPIRSFTINWDLYSCGSGNNLVCDEITETKFIRRVKITSYESGDESNERYTTDGTYTAKPLGTPIETNINLDLEYNVQQGGIEEIVADSLDNVCVPVYSGVIGYK